MAHSAVAYPTDEGYNVDIDGALLRGCQIDGRKITFEADVKYGPELPRVGQTFHVEDLYAVMDALPPCTILKGRGIALMLMRHDWEQGTLWSVTGEEKFFNIEDLKLNEVTVLHVPGKDQL